MCSWEPHPISPEASHNRVRDVAGGQMGRPLSGGVADSRVHQLRSVMACLERVEDGESTLMQSKTD